MNVVYVFVLFLVLINNIHLRSMYLMTIDGETNFRLKAKIFFKMCIKVNNISTEFLVKAKSIS